LESPHFSPPLPIPTPATPSCKQTTGLHRHLSISGFIISSSISKCFRIIWGIFPRLLCFGNIKI
jgi:hypothetical protein